MKKEGMDTIKSARTKPNGWSAMNHMRIAPYHRIPVIDNDVPVVIDIDVYISPVVTPDIGISISNVRSISTPTNISTPQIRLIYSALVRLIYSALTGVRGSGIRPRDS